MAHLKKQYGLLTGSPGLVVLGEDSCSRGRGFEPQHRILDGHFLQELVLNDALFVWKD